MSHIVVLGARVIRDEKQELVGALRRRVDAAARVHHARGWPVVATGGVLWNGERECEAMEGALTRLGVRAVLTESWSRDTGENAARCRELIGPAPIVLVTCDWHMTRACRYFECAEFSVSPVSVYGPETPRHRRWLRGAKERALTWLAG